MYISIHLILPLVISKTANDVQYNYKYKKYSLSTPLTVLNTSYIIHTYIHTYVHISHIISISNYISSRSSQILWQHIHNRANIISNVLPLPVFSKTTKDSWRFWINLCGYISHLLGFQCVTFIIQIYCLVFADTNEIIIRTY